MRLVLPLTPITPKAPSREGTTANLALSSATNSKYPGFPWQHQPQHKIFKINKVFSFS